MQQPLFAGIDAGGTDFKCIVGQSPTDVIVEQKVPVGEPSCTLAECDEFFRLVQQQYGPLEKLAVGSFGPLDLNPASPTFGYITSTPKPHWQNVDIRGHFQQQLQLDVVIDTDVNAALVGECHWGTAANLHSAVYITVGTGIGVAAMMGGKLLQGVTHLEAGHMLIARHQDDAFQGICPFHGACLEGLASGPAIAERWQEDPAALASSHPAWALQAHYLATLCVNLTLMYSPQKIIFGGGVMSRSELLQPIQNSFHAQLNEYVHSLPLPLDEYIVVAGLGSRAGALGALALARFGRP